MKNLALFRLTFLSTVNNARLLVISFGCSYSLSLSHTQTHTHTHIIECLGRTWKEKRFWISWKNNFLSDAPQRFKTSCCPFSPFFVRSMEKKETKAKVRDWKFPVLLSPWDLERKVLNRPYFTDIILNQIRTNRFLYEK